MLIDFRGTERKGKGERDGEKHQYEKHQSVASHVWSLFRDQTHNPGMCPEHELNPQLSGLWDSAPTN